MASPTSWCVTPAGTGSHGFNNPRRVFTPSTKSTPTSWRQRTWNRSIWTATAIWTGSHESRRAVSRQPSDRIVIVLEHGWHGVQKPWLRRGLRRPPTCAPAISAAWRSRSCGRRLWLRPGRDPLARIPVDGNSRRTSSSAHPAPPRDRRRPQRRWTSRLVTVVSQEWEDSGRSSTTGRVGLPIGWSGARQRISGRAGSRSSISTRMAIGHSQQRGRVRLRAGQQPAVARRAVARKSRTAEVELPYRRSPARRVTGGDVDGDGDQVVVVVSAYNNWHDRPCRVVWLENDGRRVYDARSTHRHLITLAVGGLGGNNKPTW